ncbi:MAG TPA: OmpH family outer membrane protein [Vitreimonas sp.]|jgi:Skp family chaperone for outer membrane proteins|nr:OmpH family outer membrane protein [Vitreimonas sp.]
MRVLNLAAAVAVAALLAAPTAVAQQRGGSVVVVNFQRVMSESAMGRDMQTRLGTIGTQLQQEDTALNPEGQAIQTEEQRLETASRGKTPAQIQADPTLGPQWTALQTRVQTFQQRKQALQGDAQCTRLMALRDFENAARPTLRAQMTARGAQVVIDSSNALLADPSSDVTTAVIQALDQGSSTRSLNVALHRVAECQPPQGQGGAQPAPH